MFSWWCIRFAKVGQFDLCGGFTVNPLCSCRARSVYLTTLFLGRLSPKRLTSICVHSFVWNWQLPFLNEQKGGITAENISWSISMKECRRGQTRTFWSPVKSASNWAIEILSDDEGFRFNDVSIYGGHLRQNGILTWFGILMAKMIASPRGPVWLSMVNTLIVMTIKVFFFFFVLSICAPQHTFCVPDCGALHTHLQVCQNNKNYRLKHILPNIFDFLPILVWIHLKG